MTSREGFQCALGMQRLYIQWKSKVKQMTTLLRKNPVNSEICWTLCSFFSGIKSTPPFQSPFKSKPDQVEHKYIKGTLLY